jgi:L-amino acid N-acyltransferase YncA
MGAYAQCWLDDLFVGSSKNDIDLNLISLFRPRDKIVLTPPIGALPAHLEHYREALAEDPDLRIVYYETDIRVVRDRLDVLGYDIETVEEVFTQWVKEEHARTLESIDEWSKRDSEFRKLLEEHYQTNANILAALTPRSWVEGLRVIRSSGLKTNYYGRYEGPHEKTLIGYMLSNEWYGFPGYDLFVPVRLAMEACENGRSLVYDMTDLVWSEYFDYEDDFVQYGLDVAAADYSSKAKTIVLTEGKTDAWILREALKLLYPHLEDYFSFLDFESTGFGGGVGNLANVVKAFAGSGIVNNVVALFDNDTAAAAACQTLEALPLPSNIAIRKLPRSPLLDRYPTIGPSGATNLDVNGIAGSIELYLGEDVLRGDDGNLVPVQWMGYDRQMSQYQGEVLDKARLHGRFREKLARSVATDGPEWDGLRAVLKVVFSAFASRNRAAIYQRVAEYYAR